jgi:hypothetical protein
LAAILLAVPMAVSRPAWAVTNLLPDGGLEAGQWKLIRWDRGEGKMDFTSQARTGLKAAQLQGINNAKAPINLLAHSPAIDVQADREYVLTVWHRSSGGATPTVSVFTYTQSWAKAQWKTPQSIAYQTRRLPQSQHWSPWTWRFRTAPGTVQLIVALRNGGKGTVSFDDVALFEGGDARLTLIEPGTITTLPDKRRLKAEIAMTDASARWKLSLSDQKTGRLLAEESGGGSKNPVELRYAAEDDAGLLLALEETASGAVLAVEEAAAPPLVGFEVVSPRYRNSIYLSHPPKVIRVRVKCNADALLRKGMQCGLATDDKPSWKPLDADNEFSLPVAVTPGAKSIDATVLLKGVPGRDRFVAPLKVVPPSPAGREVIIGDDNQTLVDGRPFFPAGFYGTRSGPSSDPIAKAGYTAAQTYDSNPQRCKEWLEDCQRLGLMGMVSVPRPFVDKFDEARLRDAIRLVKHQPALLAYYLFDEPSPSKPNQTPADLQRVYDVVADEDPYHPIGVCICVPKLFGTYVECYDMVMPDPYPLVKARRPLTWVSDWIDTARGVMADRKPVWVVPQAFGWDVIKDIPDPERYRTPTPAQERAMTYLALTHGARAVMYYCYHVYTRYDAAKKKAGQHPYILGGYLPDQQPTLWGSLEILGGELKRLGPALVRPGAEEGVIGSVHWRWMPQDGKEDGWLIAVNADETSPTTVTLQLNKVKLGQKVFGDGTTASVIDGVSITLPPMGTLAATTQRVP